MNSRPLSVEEKNRLAQLEAFRARWSWLRTGLENLGNAVVAVLGSAVVLYTLTSLLRLLV